MKLNPDCVRDIMLILENILNVRLEQGGIFFTCSNPFYLMRRKDIQEAGYTLEEVSYTILQLSEDGYIRAKVEYDLNRATFSLGNILYITPKGHDFISTIHNKEEWTNKIKPALRIIGNTSLSVIEAISKGFASAAIDCVIPKGAGEL